MSTQFFFFNRTYDELVNFCKMNFPKADYGFVSKKIQNIRSVQSFRINIHGVPELAPQRKKEKSS
jgi:hypothetical protein